MFPSDELLMGDKYLTPERYKTREYLIRRLYHPAEIDGSYYLTHRRLNTRLYEKELELLEHAKLRKASLDDITTNKSHSLDVVNRSELDKRIQEVTELLLEHCKALSHDNLEKLTEMIGRSSQQRAERDRNANELLRQLQNAKHEELERSIRDLERRMQSRMDALVEEVALTGRSFIEVKEEVHRLSESEGSLLRQLNAKQQNRMDTVGCSEGGSFGDIRISAVVDTIPNDQLRQHGDRLRILEQEMKETLDRLNIHHNRLGMLTQRVDECKQNNLNTLLDFKQSLTFRMENHEKRERKEYNAVCNALTELTGQVRQTELQTDAVVERINCFETMLVEKEGSLTFSQSVYNRRPFNEMNIGESLKGSNEMEGSLIFRKDPAEPGQLELSRPPNLSEFDELNVQRSESLYKRYAPLEPQRSDQPPEKPADFNDDSLEEV